MTKTPDLPKRAYYLEIGRDVCEYASVTVLARDDAEATQLAEETVQSGLGDLVFRPDHESVHSLRLVVLSAAGHDTPTPPLVSDRPIDPHLAEIGSGFLQLHERFAAHCGEQVDMVGYMAALAEFLAHCDDLVRESLPPGMAAPSIAMHPPQVDDPGPEMMP